MFKIFQNDKFAKEKEEIEESLKEVNDAITGQQYRIVRIKATVISYSNGSTSVTREQIIAELRSIGDSLNIISNSNEKLFNYMINQKTNVFTDLIKKSDNLSSEIGESMDMLVSTIDSFNRI